MQSYFSDIVRYLAFLRRLASEALWAQKWRFFMVLSTGFLGAAGPPAALGQLAWYAKILEHGKTVRRFGYAFIARESELLLLAMAGAVFMSLLLGAIMGFIARRTALDLAVEHERRLVERIVLQAYRCLRMASPMGNPVCGEGELRKLLASDARIAARMVLVLLGGVIPLFSMLLYSAMLFWINVPLTLIVLLVTVLSGVFLSRVARRGARASILLERHSSEASDEKRKLLRLAEASSLTQGGVLCAIRECVRRGMIERCVREFRFRLLALDYSTLVSTILAAFSFSLILLYLGGGAIAGAFEWGLLALYFVTLRMFLRDVQQLARRATSIGRFYPIIKRQYAFLDQTRLSDGSEPVDSLVLAPPCRVEGMSSGYTVSRGSWVAVASPLSLDRYSVSFVIDGLASGDSLCADRILSDLHFVASVDVWPGQQVHECLGCGDASEVKVCLEAFGLPEAIQEEITGMATGKTLADEEWRRLSTTARSAVLLIGVARSDKAWVAVDLQLFRAFLQSIEAEDCVRQWFADKCLLLVHEGLAPSIQRVAVDCVAVIGDRELLAVGNAEELGANSELADKLKEVHASIQGKTVVLSSAAEEEI